MNTHIAYFEGSLPRVAPGLPQRVAAPKPAVWTGVLDRLAAWAERQPSHHRMGSYTRR